MQESEQHKISDGTQRVYDQHGQQLVSYSWAPIQNVENNLSSEDSSEGAHFFVEVFEQHRTLESSSSGTDGYNAKISPSTANFSPEKNPFTWPNSQSYQSELHHSPDNSCGSPVSALTDNEYDFRYKLRELETAMLGPDTDNLDIYSSIILGEEQIPTDSEQTKYIMEIISRRDLREMLCTCTKAIENNDIYAADCLMTELHQMVSVSGEPIQRLGAYMLEELIARLAASGSFIYKALICKEPVLTDLLAYMHQLYEICPYFKFGYMPANGAIAEAMKDGSRVHIIDFQIAQGTSGSFLLWLLLLGLEVPQVFELLALMIPHQLMPRAED